MTRRESGANHSAEGRGSGIAIQVLCKGRQNACTATEFAKYCYNSLNGNTVGVMYADNVLSLHP